MEVPGRLEEERVVRKLFVGDVSMLLKVKALLLVPWFPFIGYDFTRFKSLILQDFKMILEDIVIKCSMALEFTRHTLYIKIHKHTFSQVRPLTLSEGQILYA